jgi:hypothetical protein
VAVAAALPVVFDDSPPPDAVDEEFLTDVELAAPVAFGSPGELPPRATITTNQITKANATTRAPMAKTRRRQ